MRTRKRKFLAIRLSTFLGRRARLTPLAQARGEWTLEVLRLNREVVRKARATAPQSYRASLLEYGHDKQAGATDEELAKVRAGILAMPHPSVLNELIRKADTQPTVQRAMAAAPEIGGWLR
ncbi:MAG: hypothetical protein INR62_12010 [Rhodospirillales bacterium]|nr:hypothetical protein [Acetobacter sp.]